LKNRIFCVFVMILLIASYASAATENMALELKSDPNSFFEAPNHAAFHEDLGNTFTAEAWIFSIDQAGERMVINKEDTYEFAVRESGVFQTALRPAGGGWDWHSSEASVDAEKWTHVAITWDGAVVRMFVDGKIAPGSEAIEAPGLNITDSTFKVGRRERGDETHSIFDGLVDEVRLSTGLRYTGDYTVPEGAFEPDADTVALYHFDEVVGADTITDFSKNGIDGRLAGNAVLVPSDAPTRVPTAVEARDRLATVWARLKAR
jgi:hypothetical protein